MPAEVGSPIRRVPSWRRWTVACGAGETVGMAAAAGVAVALRVVVGEPDDWPSGLLVWAGSVAGGAVEGVAVGVAQYLVLSRWLPRLSAARWVTLTLAVALAGWALGMLWPAVISWQVGAGTDPAVASAGPPLVALTAVGAVAGLVFGAVFGAVQRLELRRHVVRSRRWITANALGWAGAMAVIMTGASIPDAEWPLARIVALGAVTGVVAGLVIGGVTGLFLPALDAAA